MFLLTMKNAPQNLRSIFLFGGERGIRLHTAGRGWACMPNPSNLPRDVRRDIASLKNENAPQTQRGIFLFGGERGILRQNTKSAFSVVNYSVYLRTCVENML